MGLAVNAGLIIWNEDCRRVATGGGGGHVTAPHNFSVPPPPRSPHKTNHVYIFLFANIARELILCTPTKIVLICS